MIRSMLTASAVMMFAMGVTGGASAKATSAAVRAACTGDAHKLCQSVISNTPKRQACMRAHSSQLSKGCIAALKAAK
jgi:hypothetical protein